jgi:glycosyltransferase involved in cell wall biosynthesis
LEPFFGGSHRDFAEGVISHSRHRIDLLTLPARFWKWRMRGAALYYTSKIPSLKKYDGLITTDLMSLSDLKALWGPTFPPALVYFHENQVSYPLAPGESIDYQFGWTDITTALAADRVIFNSHTHLKAFFSLLPGFIDMMPEYEPKWVVDSIRSRAEVIYPGCQFPATKPLLKDFPSPAEAPPLIIWNHRWEFDKNPEDFFAALDAMLDNGFDFRLALLGENFQKVPKAFIAAKQRYRQMIVQYGYVKSKEKYCKWLQRGTIVISTAKQENFGIATVEAIRFGCLPLLPNRLSYPEIIPDDFHQYFLYQDQVDLVSKLMYLLSNLVEFQESRDKISEAMGQYSWENRIDQFDEELEALAGLKD